MDKHKDGFPETYKLFDPLAPIKWLGRVAREACTMHQLASHGDHFVHPLDDVFDHPPYTEPVQGQLEL